MIKLDKVLLLSHLSAWLSAIKAYVDGRIVEVSRATLEAMEGVESSITSLENSVAGKAESGHGHSSMTAATASAAGKAGFVPAPAAGNQAKYLRGDGTWQTPYTHPTSAGNKHIPSGGASGQILKWSAAGTAVWADDSGAPSTYYGTCATAAATAAKVITAGDGFTLTAGKIIVVKFSATNTAQNPTFNVNGTGAKSVWYNTALITTGNLGYAGTANRPMAFMYDGTQYVFIGWSVDNNTTYTNAALGQGYGTCATAAATAAKVVTLSNYALVTGGIVAVKFTYAVPASATLNINSKGAKPIYHNGAAIMAGIIEAGDIGFFIYNGSQYILIGVDRIVTAMTDAEIDAICV